VTAILLEEERLKALEAKIDAMFDILEKLRPVLEGHTSQLSLQSTAISELAKAVTDVYEEWRPKTNLPKWSYVK